MDGPLLPTGIEQEENRMIVLIIANQSGEALAPLTNQSTVPLLPVVGKSLLEHCIEWIAPTKPDSIVIAGSRQLIAVRGFVNDGKRWGTPIQTLSCTLNEPAESIIKRNGFLKKDDLLVVYSDRLFNDPLATHLASLQALSNDHGAAVQDRLSQLEYHPAALKGSSQKTEIIPVTLENLVVHVVDSLASFHAVNLMAARGEISSLRYRGAERAIGLITGYKTKLHPKSVQSGHVVAGNRCRVHKSCRFEGSVVLHDDIILDRFTQVSNTVILQDTYIGEHLNITNAIVYGNLLIRVDTNTELELSDRFLTASISQGFYQEHFAKPLNRMAGVALLLASLPLWPVAFISASLQNRGNAIVFKEIVGNKYVANTKSRQTFKSMEFLTSMKLLRYLPLTVAVASGHMRLLGTSPYTKDDLPDEMESWQSGGYVCPIGLIGPTQLYLGIHAPSDQRMLCDTAYAQTTRNAAQGFRLLTSAIRHLWAPEQFTETQLWNNDILAR